MSKKSVPANETPEQRTERLAAQRIRQAEREKRHAEHNRVVQVRTESAVNKAREMMVNLCKGVSLTDSTLVETVANIAAYRTERSAHVHRQEYSTMGRVDISPDITEAVETMHLAKAIQDVRDRLEGKERDALDALIHFWAHDTRFMHGGNFSISLIDILQA